MMDKIHAKVTEKDGRLVADLLGPDNQTVDNVVLKTFFPLGFEMIQVAFYDMPHDRAIYYTNVAMFDVLAAIADVSGAVALPGEKWYELRLGAPPAMIEKILSTLSFKLGDKGLGWVNPVVLTFPGNQFAVDLALSDESGGRQLIDTVLMRYQLKKWSLKVKPDGLNVEE